MNTINLKKIKHAAAALSQTSESARNLFLKNLSQELIRNKKKILAANVTDVQKARDAKLAVAFIERLTLTEKGFADIIAKITSVQKLKSGLGEAIETTKHAGLTLKKVRVPLGVLMVIYEARPEVTVDVAALCVKSGNAVILKGGSEAIRTNTALYECIRKALKQSGFSENTVSFVEDRKTADTLLAQHDAIDLVIARGGYGMVKSVMAKTKIPVLAHAAGGARIYIDKSADLDMAEKILVNAKITKPSACNSLDTILVHKAIAKTFVPRITKAMHSHGVSIVSGQWNREFLGLEVNIRVVSGVEDAVAFIGGHTKHHTEGIVAKDKKIIEKFVNGVDAAALFVNASTRLHDGYVFGLGSEMGISTSKLHARGPVGLKELTTYTWQIYGNGNIRK